MPASRFDGTDLFLKVHLAQKEGLISVASEVRARSALEVWSDMSVCYC